MLKINYYDIILEEAENDSRKIWRIVNELIDRKQCKQKMPNRFIIDGESIRNKSNIATACGDYIERIGSDQLTGSDIVATSL